MVSEGSEAYLCGIVFVICDLLQSLATLAFYSYQQFDHRYCSYAHGVPACDYFLVRSNHSTRVIIGIAEGILGIAASLALGFCFFKKNSYVVWSYLTKPLVVLVLNLYFVIVWLVQRGRFYHTYESEEQVEQESLYIYVGFASILVQVLLGFIFCCIAAGFFYQNRTRRTRLNSTSSSNQETKV